MEGCEWRGVNGAMWMERCGWRDANGRMWMEGCKWRGANRGMSIEVLRVKGGELLVQVHSRQKARDVLMHAEQQRD